MKLTAVTSILLLLTTIGLVNSARILSISFVSSKSHKIVYEPLLHSLADKGHEIVIVGSTKSTKEPPKNVKNIQVFDSDQLIEEMGMGTSEIFEMKVAASGLLSVIENPFISFRDWMETGCRKGLSHPIMKDIMKEKWDLIIFPPLFNDCLYGLIHKLNTSTIIISQVAVMPWVAGPMGSPTLPSFTPLLFYGFGDEMNFFERVANFLGMVYFAAVREYYYIPNAERLYRELIDPNLPSVREIEKNSSLVLANSHLSFAPPRPLLPDIIEVGGMHLRPPKQLPKDLDDFFNGAKDGFILFSMGSWLKTSNLPERYFKVFLNTFAKLKPLRVIWKWEKDSMEGIPDNVKMMKWLPQQDVLGHKNCRLFITHGGHGSTTEALYAGVPLVAIPMFGDQMSNTEQAVKLGIAERVEFAELSEDILFNAINKVVKEPSFSKRVKQLSDIYKDQVDDPLQRAIFWCEYVLRHGGAPHLRSASRNLNFYQYYSLDVIAFIAIVLLSILTINILILKAILKNLFGTKKAPSSTSSKTKSPAKKKNQ